MGISLKEELTSIRRDLQGRFLKVAIDFSAPRVLAQADPQRRWQRDVLGALVVSVMAIPQAMAYAILAGVPPLMGLYSIVIVSLVAGLWCHSTHLACGPTNTSALMLATVVLAHGAGVSLPTLVALVALVMGLFQIVSGILGIGGLTKFISRTVIIGYTSAMGFLISFNQIPNLIGTDVNGVKGLFAKMAASLATIPHAHLPSVLTAAVTLAAIELSRRLIPKIPAGFMAIVAGSVFAWALREGTHGSMTVKLVEDIQRIPLGLPSFVLPVFNLASIYELAGPAIALGLLGCIEASTISKNLAMRTDQSTRPNQDIFALGLGNAVGAFFGAMPGSGSFTRSEFSLRSGVTSRLGIVFSALIALAVVMLGGRVLEKIPIPALAALIIWISIQLIHLKHIRVALFSTRSDGLAFVTTFLAALFLRLDYAVYLGMLVSMGLFLQKASVPRLMEFEFDEEGRFRQTKRTGASGAPQISIVHVEGELFFGAVESVREDIWNSVDRQRTKVVVLRLRNALNLDASGALVLAQLYRDLQRLGIALLISGTTTEIDRVIARSGLDQIIGRENYFPSGDNFLDATRRAVKRANEIVGAEKAEVRLYYDKDKEQARAQSSWSQAR